MTGFGGSWTENGVTFNYTVSDGEACVSITSCGDSAAVVIPSEIDGYKVTSIGETSSDCRTLASVVIPDDVTNIGKDAFYCCHSLTSVTIPNSVTNIGWGAFRSCGGLTSVTIPDSVTSIGDCAFQGCRGLADSEGFVVVQGVLHDYVGGKAVATIPDSVTSIGGLRSPAAGISHRW